MTKTQATEAGKAYGEMYGTAMTDDMLRRDSDAAMDDIRQAANSRVFDIGVRSVSVPNAIAYTEAFRLAAIRTYRERRNLLPDVAAANKLEAFQYALGSMLRSAEGALETFQKRFAEDPCYAFEWADNAMQAAAEVYVAKAITAWMEKTGNDLVAVEQQILKMVHQGARYPSHSTSQPTNLMNQFKTAAFAAFVRVGA